MILNIIKKKKIFIVTSNHVMISSTLLLFGLLGCLYFEILHANTLIVIVISVLVLIPIATNIYGNYEYFPKDFDTVSILHLNEDKIIVDKREFDLAEIKKITFEINDCLGEKIVRNIDSYGSGPKLSMGVNNLITIILKDEEQIILPIQLESKVQLQDLANCIKNLYKSNIEINEKYTNSRSYGLDLLNYAEIQEFKKQYYS